MTPNRIAELRALEGRAKWQLGAVVEFNRAIRESASDLLNAAELLTQARVYMQPPSTSGMDAVKSHDIHESFHAVLERIDAALATDARRPRMTASRPKALDAPAEGETK